MTNSSTLLINLQLCYWLLVFVLALYLISSLGTHTCNVVCANTQVNIKV